MVVTNGAGNADRVIGLVEPIGTMIDRARGTFSKSRSEHKLLDQGNQAF
jgi:hypothetical protein